jgi:hypothetical protein
MPTVVVSLTCTFCYNGIFAFGAERITSAISDQRKKGLMSRDKKKLPKGLQ